MIGSKDCIYLERKFDVSKTKILLLAEHDNKNFHSVTKSVLAAGFELAKILSDPDKTSEPSIEITILVAGFECKSVAEKLSDLIARTPHAAPNTVRILVMSAKPLAHGLAENIAAAMMKIASEFQYILGPASTYGKNIIPRLAALSDVAQISDVVAILAADTFKHPIYAGNAIEMVQSLDPIKIMTIRGTAFELHHEKSDTVASTAKPVIEEFHIDNKDCDLKLSEFIQEEKTKLSRPELSSARVIIAGGRGLQSAANFKLLEDIADKLHAAIGASRAAVDAGFINNDYQVGQTGKVVAPELYIAVGISGAIQHLAGMKDSKVIVAINKDPDAPIFQIADYGLVGDLFQILPEFDRELANTLN